MRVFLLIKVSGLGMFNFLREHAIVLRWITGLESH